MAHIVILCGIFSLFITVSFTSKVPVLIWSNDRSLSVPHALAGHTVSAEEFSKLYLNGLAQSGSRNIVLFIQDKLSLYDITLNSAVFEEDESEDALKSIKGFMSSLAVTQVPSVDNPIAAIADLRTQFSVEFIHELRAPYQVSDLSLDPSGGNLVIVKLPETAVGDSSYRKSLKDIDAIVGSVVAQLNDLVAPYVAIYSATKSSKSTESPAWKNIALSHSGRQLLEATTAQPSTVSPLANINGSFLFYADNLTVIANQSSFTYDTDGSYWDVSGCENGSMGCDVTLKFKGGSQPLTLTLNMGLTGANNGGFWFVNNFQVSFNGKAVNMSTSFVELTPLGYSYHCYPLTAIKSIDASITVRLFNFQIQAFSFPVKGRFGHYNDCVGFFSVPIWMGVISSFVLIGILLFGVIMLMSIKTMDRFDDPKGKTITVTATD